jgi:regulator of protease activity HflC (stomatin/prohibitin superfamily)
MEQNIKRVGLMNWVALLATAAGMLLTTRFSGSAAGLMGAIVAGIGALVALLSYCQMSLEAREELEKLELEELSKTRGGASIFAAAADDTFPARRSRQQFERYFIPALAVLLLLLEGAAAWFPWKSAPAAGLVKDRATLAMALTGLMGLILFLLGKYSSGLARLQKERLLRPGAAYLLLSAYACFIGTATMAASLAGFGKADLIAARGLCVVVGLIALETLVGLVLEIYRVRVKGKDSRLLYESRLVGLLGEPEAIITTAAHALDYQFGFKVSETWFYRFLEKALAWLLLAQVGILALSSCVVVIEPGQQALLERFGAPVAGRGVIGPGLHFKLPWPIDQVYRTRTEQIQGFIVGAEPETSKVIQWTRPHAKEDNFLVAYRAGASMPETNEAPEAASQPGAHQIPPVNLLAVSIPVQFQITNLEQWTYVNNEPTNLLQMVARREVVRFLASVDLGDLMSRGRGKAAETLRASIQRAANERELGVNITFVGMQDIHPPQKVAEAYENVVSEREKREAKILEAESHAKMTNAQAAAVAFTRLAQAGAEKARAETNAAARAILFTNQALAYAAAPGPDGVYEHRAYLDVLTGSTRDAQRKIILATAGNSNQIFEFNLEEKIHDLGTGLTIPKAN